MAGLLRPSGRLLSPRRLLLPGSNPSIDRTHPLANGLLACYLPGLTRGVDISGRVAILPLLGSAPLTQACPEGIAYLNNGTTQSSWGGIVPPSNMLGLNQMTFYVRWQQTGTGIGTAGTGVHFALWDITNGQVVGLANSGTLGQILAKGESNTTGLQTGTFAPTVGVMQSATSTYVAGGVLSLYHNGIFVASTAQAAAPTSGGTWNIFLCGGPAGSTVPPQQVGMYMAACWNRALSTDEITALDQDPYAFLAADEAEMASLSPSLNSFFGPLPKSSFAPKLLPRGPNLAVDWSHPLTNGLIAAFVPGVTGGVNLTSKCAPLAIKTATDTRKSTQEGPSWTTTADSAGLFGASCPAAFKTWTQFSIYWRGFFTSYTTNNTKVFGIEFDNIGSTPFAVASLGYGGSTGTNFVCEWNTNGTYTHDVGVALTAGMQGLCGTFKVGGNVVLYRNGLVIDTTAFGATAPTSAASSLINFQTANGNAGNFSGSGNVGYMWNRELSASEVVQLEQDPYCFLVGDLSGLPDLPGTGVGVAAATFFDVADNPVEPFVLQPPSLSPAQPFAIRTADTPVSQEVPFPVLALKQPILSNAQPFAILIENPTPSQDLAFWMEQQGIQRQTPPVDTNQPDWYNEDFLEPNVWWWAEPPDLLRHAPHLDTNQPDWFNETQNEPNVWWWDQPPDLLRHAAHLDTNLSRLVSQQFATPSTLSFWFEPLDLERRPQQHDPNQSRLSYQDQATPTDFDFWFEPIDLERHPTQTDPNQSRVSYQDQATPSSFRFWSEPPDLLRHPSALDTNQGLDLWFIPLSTAPATTPSAWWWTQPPDLFRHAAHLDTNLPQLTLAALQAFATPTSKWWDQPPDLLKHPASLDTNQGFDYAYAIISLAAAVTPSVYWWTQPPDLQWHPRQLDTNESRLVSQQFAEPNVWWWTQAQFQQRAPNTLSVQSYLPQGWQLNSLGLLAPAPPFMPPTTPTLWMGQPYSPQGWQLSSLGLLADAPPFMPPRVPILLPVLPYVAQGWQLTANGLIVPAPSFMPPSAPNLAVAPFSPAPLGAVTPKSLAFFAQPHLFKHPLELFTWQYRVGAIFLPPNATPADTSYFGQPQDLLRRPAAYVVQPWTLIPGFKVPFFGSAFVANRLRLSQPSTKARHNIAVKGLSSLSSANTILRGFRRMSRAPDLSPPIVAGVEQEYVTFDFAQGLNTGINISAIIAVNVYSLTGNDATPMARLLNTPTIIASPSSSVASQAVYGLFGNMIAGLYLLQAIIQTSDGQVLSTEARWPCVPATP